MLPMFISLSSAAAAPAALVVEPVAPALGVRLAPSDRLQLDLTLGPEFVWTRNNNRFETDFGLEDSVIEQTIAQTSWGVTLPTLRLRLADAPTVATVSAGGRALRRTLSPDRCRGRWRGRDRPLEQRPRLDRRRHHPFRPRP